MALSAGSGAAWTSRRRGLGPVISISPVTALDPLPRSLEDRLQLGVADQLQRRAPLGVGAEGERRAQRRVDQEHAALLVEHQHPLLHRLQDHLQQIALGAQRGERRGEVPRHHVERPPQLGDLVGADRARAHREIAGGHPLGRLGHAAERAREHLRGRAGEHDRHDERQAQRRPQDVAQLADGGVDLVERDGQAGRAAAAARAARAGSPRT